MKSIYMKVGGGKIVIGAKTRVSAKHSNTKSNIIFGTAVHK